MTTISGTIPLETYFSVKATARMLGVSEVQALWLCRDGGPLPRIWSGKRWYVPADAVQAYAAGAKS